MDYSQFQVKYIENPTFVLKVPEISNESFEIPDVSNISYLNGDAEPATALILEEVPTNPVKKVIKRTPPALKPSAGLTQFNNYYDLAITQDTTGQLAARRNLFTRLAQSESSFVPDVRNKGGLPAYGYFLFMLGQHNGKYFNNIGLYAGVDLETFRRNPIILIQAANNLANSFLKSFSKLELLRLHLMGYSDSAIIAGSWLGGPGGVRAFAFKNLNRRDKHGTAVGDYMQKFNNL